VHLTASEPAPYVDLRALPAGEPGWLDSLSPGTRYQLRRSIRRYETRGPLLIRRAATLPEARMVFADLARLHQASWTARGRKGAFARAFFQRFHAALIEECLPRGEIELLRISAGEHLIGCLYNLRHGDIVLSYQSGFADRDIHKHDKPGLVCHSLAIEQARAEGLSRYDFLAGSNRTKTAFANASTDLHWFDLVRPWSPRGVIGRLGWRR
jgi:CelD/BcsL family acetyltransferase involved in cellulose biosynthesis